jgi:LmbE family N-acetylglucosaminyl deacetylase
MRMETEAEGKRPVLIPVLVLVAHPDDETLGAGMWLHRHRATPRHILHLTDGSPKDMQDARTAGFNTRSSYAVARRNELQSALQLIEIPPENCRSYNCPDKEAYLHLPALVTKVESFIRRLNPYLVISSAYEGGHPDHDAVALVAAMVHRRLSSFQHWEFPLYHAGRDGEMITGEFLPGSAPAAASLDLTPAERDLKHRMLACFPSQTAVLSHFPVDREQFRPAPLYDFAQAPHPGPLLYERWGWGVSGSAWTRRACAALNSLNHIVPTT